MSLIATALAATPGASAGAQQSASGMSTILILLVFFAVFYFLMIRPQQKKAKEHRAMISNVTKGDEIITSGGILGVVVNVSDDYLTVELAEGVAVKLQKQAVSNCLPKGTVKSI